MEPKAAVKNANARHAVKREAGRHAVKREAGHHAVKREAGHHAVKNESVPEGLKGSAVGCFAVSMHTKKIIKAKIANDVYSQCMCVRVSCTLHYFFIFVYTFAADSNVGADAVAFCGLEVW